ncbi:MAG: prepilin-type N-terminal cleavage/methylation domain-containing protein [Clostridiales Family XIII bacterium]|jgi:prepilin-type N-terminal cleavage/methylation domain-containing protein|nr:prepilin-type N-terminal cleavage/methylation domain-containing protein [Clostridiales Family XIII bacterium]
MRRTANENKGFTLVEVIVTFVILGILIVVSSGLIISSSRLTAHTADRATNSSVADAALDFVAGQLLYAPAVTVIPQNATNEFNAALAGERAVVYTGDASGAVATNGKGMLWFKRADASSAINLLGGSFYHKRLISLQYRVDKVENNKPKAVTLTVFIYNQDGELTLKRSTSLQLLNTQASGAAIKAPPYDVDEGEIYHDPPTQALILEIASPDDAVYGN